MNYIIDVSNNDKLDQCLRYYRAERKGGKARVIAKEDEKVAMRNIYVSDVIKGDYQIVAHFTICPTVQNWILGKRTGI